MAAQTDAAKDASSKLINDAGAWSAENLKQASGAAKDDIKAAVSAAMSTVQTDIQAARKAKAVAILAALTAVAIGGAFLGGGFGFWLAGNWSAFHIRG